jgi:hypothetical protein
MLHESLDSSLTKTRLHSSLSTLLHDIPLSSSFQDMSTLTYTSSSSSVVSDQLVRVIQTLGSDLPLHYVPVPCSTYSCRVFVAMCHAAGHKSVYKCLPVAQSATLLVSVIHTIHDDMSWEERYALLAWTSMLVLTPFPLESIRPQFVEEIQDLAVRYLFRHTMEYQPACLVIVRLFARKDTSVQRIERFVEMCLNQLNQRGNAISDCRDLGLVRIRVLQVVTEILVRLPREIVFPICCAQFADMYSYVVHSGFKSSSGLERKLCIKLIQRAILVLMPVQNSNLFSQKRKHGKFIKFLL